jgi:hypothetical protein
VAKGLTAKKITVKKITLKKMTAKGATGIAECGGLIDRKAFIGISFLCLIAVPAPDVQLLRLDIAVCCRRHLVDDVFQTIFSGRCFLDDRLLDDRLLDKIFIGDRFIGDSFAGTRLIENTIQTISL